MKRITYFIMAGFMLCLLPFTPGCKTESKPVEEPIPSAAYKAIMVKHSVASYPAWKDVYMGDDSVRQAYGMTPMFIARGSEDTSSVLVMNKMADVQKAKDFAASPELKMTMEKAGVTGPPTVAFLDVVRDDTSNIPQNDRVLVVHKVKDYDTWLKVYDGEGRATRAANGLLDRGLAREIDDPNMIYIVFAVVDKDKAMARMQSEELKKLMTDAGIEGAPSFYFYTLQK